MAVLLALTAKDRLSLGYNGTGSGYCGYNGEKYDPITNPGGMDGNGVTVNWVNMAADMVALGLSTAQQAQMVSGYLAGVNGWTQEIGTISRLSGTQFTVSGGVDKASLYKTNRAISIIQTASGTGYVSSSSYDPETGLTTVTVSGVTLDTGLAEIWFGQDPSNAPLTISSPIANQVFG